MVLSKRAFLKLTSAAALAGVSAPALALEGGSGIIIALLAAATVVKGEDAPKPAKLRFSKRELQKLNEAGPRKSPRLLAQMLNQKLSKAWGIKFDGVDGESIDKGIRGKGLTEGKHVILARTKGPKWEIKITIVIKF